MNKAGVLITFEGAEGSGKSTQIGLIHKYLQQRGCAVTLLREPGGVRISESIRRILLDVRNEGMTRECETLLYMAARSQVVAERIRPALQAGQIVLCDRFLDSTVAYQGHGNGVDIGFIRQIGALVTQGIAPNLTFLFDIEPEQGLARTGRTKDRIELRSLRYHQRVRKGYLEIASQEPDRICVIKVDKTKDAIHQAVRQRVDRLLGLPAAASSNIG